MLIILLKYFFPLWKMYFQFLHARITWREPEKRIRESSSIKTNQIRLVTCFGGSFFVGLVMRNCTLQKKVSLF